MLRLPPRFAAMILAFAPVFVQQRTWRHARLLLLGAMLAPGQRTVGRLLRIVGLRRERHFVNYHRVLNRAVWNSRHGARLLLGLLISRFVPTGPIVLGVDDTIERRRGKRISAKGIYRDPVRSSKSFFVKTSGLRWLSLMLLAPVPWAQRIWGLPFLTVLAPSERFCRTHNHRHKKLTDWTRQVALQARRWLPERTIVLVGDSSFAVLDLLAVLTRQGLICLTRLRLEAALYKPVPPREAGAIGRPRKKGARLPTLSHRLQDAKTEWQSVSVAGWYGNTERHLQICSESAVWYHPGLPVLPIRWILLRDPKGDFEPQALLCTDLTRDPHDIIGWFVRRWSLEVTFRETRDHLGVASQRQWSDQAIARTTPCLLALFSIITLLGTRLTKQARFAVSTAAWYPKPHPTFADTLAAVRREIWNAQGFSMSRSRTDRRKPSRALCEGMTYALCNAA
jgi:hypothetical protein